MHGHSNIKFKKNIQYISMILKYAIFNPNFYLEHTSHSHTRLGKLKHTVLAEVLIFWFYYKIKSI